MKKKKDSKEKKIEEETENKKFSDKSLLIGAGIIILLLIAIFALRIFIKPEEPKTIDELHALNLEGKLKPEQGYIYNGYSFVNVNDFWHTKIKSPNGRILYSLTFRFGPNDVSGMDIRGRLNTTLFDSSDKYYATFDPTGFGGDFTHVTLAVADFNQNMVKAFSKNPIAACDKNETTVCKSRPVIDCSNTDKLVFYIQEAEVPEVVLDDNCIIIRGDGFDLIKAVDRLLLDFYGIME